MISLIYVSKAVSSLNDDELAEILRVSRENNGAGRVTGMLLYKGGNFMQLLEGPQDEVLALFERIKDDPRHCDATILSIEEIHMRQFPEWEMAFCNLDTHSLKSARGFSEFQEDDFMAEIFRKMPIRAYIMLVTIKENIR